MKQQTEQKKKIKFSQAFWVANTVELFERAAYYGVFIVITLYLSRILGFNDLQAASIAGVFSACLYLLPTFAGALADKIGFRGSMLLAFSLLTCGYLGLAIYPTWLEAAGLVSYGTTTTFTGLLESGARYGILPIMALIVCGGAFIKSVISGTVAKETTPETRAKGFSIFYAMVNIGAFSGKTIVKPLREALGNEGFITLNYFSATMTFLALLAIWFLYKSDQHSGEGKSFTAANLAVSFALMERKTLIVGMDIRKPALNRLFSLSHKSAGITQYLASPASTDLLALCQPVSISPYLYVLPGGAIPPNPTELVARKSLDEAFALLRQHFDYIILDSAPIGIVTDTRLIARVADICVYVCRADFTHKNDYALINDLKQDKKLPTLCTLINGIDMDKRKNGYYYGYGKYGKYGKYGYGKKYGYGYGYGYGKE